ncbi:unnamed protein product [Mytilus coruscus]|uniref:Uncharacterized protein n=1 Tax=Mytilus coruscus TaxID=42192 RepID=A0A6J8BEW3_MYTCO|nr:unnamed protein product [Mytilus coruscus]
MASLNISSPSSNTPSYESSYLGECTSSWTNEKELTRLNIETVSESSPDEVFEMGFRDFFKGDKQVIIHYLKKHFPPCKSNDLHLKVEKECFEFTLNEILPVNCEDMEDVDAAALFRFKKEIETKSFAEYTMEPKYSYDRSWLQNCKSCEENDKNYKTKETTCQQILYRLKNFSDQLLIMTNNRKKMDLTNKMFQDLFLSFVRIFDIMIIDDKNFQAYNMTVGTETIRSEPDAVICKFFPTDVLQFTEKVIAVVHVEEEKDSCENISAKLKRRKTDDDKTSTTIGHIGSNLKGQHTGEMIAALPSSVFGFNGVFGFIVQGSKVTVTSLHTSGQFWEQLKKGKYKNAHATVRYSPQCNILTKQGRSQLIDIFLGMKVLLRCLEL